MSLDPWQPGTRSLLQHYRIVLAVGAAVGLASAAWGWKSASSYLKKWKDDDQ
jgi:hypothetical protein